MTVAELKVKVREVWVKACEHDGIDADETFVCLSPDNPFLPEYDSLMRKYQLVMRVKTIGTIGILK
jgi:hypothetical protein